MPNTWLISMICILHVSLHIVFEYVSNILSKIWFFASRIDRLAATAWDQGPVRQASSLGTSKEGHDAGRESVVLLRRFRPKTLIVGSWLCEVALCLFEKQNTYTYNIYKYTVSIIPD